LCATLAKPRDHVVNIGVLKRSGSLHGG
jgi:hypothetical protein